MKKSFLALLAATSLLLMGCTQNIKHQTSDTEDEEEEVALTPDEQATRDIVGTWSYSYEDNDGTPTNNTYDFNEDGTLVETVTATYPGGTLKMVSNGKWKVRDNIIEFLYELDDCKAYLDGVINDEFTQALREEDKNENLKVRDYKERGETYGFPIIRVSANELVLNMQGEEITLTKQ